MCAYNSSLVSYEYAIYKYGNDSSSSHAENYHSLIIYRFFTVTQVLRCYDMVCVWFRPILRSFFLQGTLLHVRLGDIVFFFFMFVQLMIIWNLNRMPSYRNLLYHRYLYGDQIRNLHFRLMRDAPKQNSDFR